MYVRASEYIRVHSNVAKQEDVEDNPYHKLHLEGHEQAVRALAARGRTLVSGSYDCTVRIWDIITGENKWVLVGHTQKGAFSISIIFASAFIYHIHDSLLCGIGSQS